MNKVDLIIGQFNLDLFKDEDITISLNAQDATDISKVFTDFTQSFTIPASKLNNQILGFYYRTDLLGNTIVQAEPIPWNSIADLWQSLNVNAWNEAWERIITYENGWNYQYRQPGYIELNSNMFRTGTYALESVEMKDGEPYAYRMTFYGAVTRLSDIFGEAYLSDLWVLNEYDHQYIPSEVKLLTEPVASRPDLLYPLISPVRHWDWNSHGSMGDEDDIKWSSGGGHLHGIHWYELKPALRVQKLIEGIQDQFGITFTGSLFGTAPFTDLYLWLHKKAGYMYQGQPSAVPFTRLVLDQVNIPPADDWWNYTTYEFTAQGFTGSGNVYNFYIDVSTTYAFDYTIALNINGIQRSSKLIAGGGNYAGTFGLQIPVTTNDVGWVEISTSTNEAASFTIAQFKMDLSFTPFTNYVDVTGSSPTILIGEMITREVCPEIKVKDFFVNLLKMHNAVCINENPLDSREYRVDTLETWYSDGYLQAVKRYFDTSSYTISRPDLYRLIEFKYKEPKAILNNEYAQRNRVAYGDLQAEFAFDSSEYKVQIGFEQMLMSRLTDNISGVLTNVCVGYALNQTLQPELGGPYLFYIPTNYVTPVADIGWIVNTTQDKITKYWLANSSNTLTNTTATYSLNFGADIDAFFLSAPTQSLFDAYFKTQIQNLYDTRCRLLQIKGVLPLFELLQLKLNNAVEFKDTIWRINKVDVNLTTGECDFQLINLQYNSFYPIPGDPGTIPPIPEPLGPA